MKRMTVEQFRRELAGGSKYRNEKTVVNGETFDSKKEAWRYAELLLLEKAGEIHNLRRQVKYELIPKQDGERAAYYIADFVYVEGDQLVVEDCKGYRTKEYRLKRKIFFQRYGIKIRET